MVARISLFLLLICSFASNSFAQSLELVPKFDYNLIKYYKVDTCRVYENVNNGKQTIQYLKKIYIFNPDGTIAQEIEVGKDEYDAYNTIKFSYDENQNISRKAILRPGREPIVYDYYYTGKKWTKMVVSYPVFKEFEVQTNDQNLVLGILVWTNIPKIDEKTGEYTNKDTFAVAEEYEFRYNRFNKIAKENYYYKDRGLLHSIVYEYANREYGLPLTKSYYEGDNKEPSYVTHYTYDGTGFLHMEVKKETDTGYINTLEYEYAYAWDSPIYDKIPPLKKGQKFWIGKNKK